MELINAINKQSIPIYAWNRLWSITKCEKIVDVSTIPFHDFDFVKSDFVNEITKTQKLKKELEINCNLPDGTLQAEIKQLEAGELFRLTGFYINGEKKHESFLLNGVKCDTWTQWYSNGLIKGETKYIESKPIYEKLYYQNGVIQKSIDYNNTGKWSTMTEWYDNGQIMFENNNRSEYKRYSRNGELVDSYLKNGSQRRCI
jgi:antitoxin component YwqK of YwqJK toxin-antitoxin module